MSYRLCGKIPLLDHFPDDERLNHRLDEYDMRFLMELPAGLIVSQQPFVEDEAGVRYLR